MGSLESYLKSVSGIVSSWVGDNFAVPSGSPSKTLYESMRYSFDAGGKRLRPALLIMSYNIFSEKPLDKNHPALPFAAAVEMVHTYSLIHDDLPGMDNDDFRRGKPTNHKVFGEATAILAGDGLLTKAFEIFLDSRLHNVVPASAASHAALALAKAVGPDGMVAGQYADMLAEGKTADNELVKYVHTHKTGDFIAVSVEIGGILAGADGKSMQALKKYGTNVGLAFQITDDILDLTSTTEKLGKTAKSDIAQDKLTYPKVFGLDESRKLAKILIDEASFCLECFGDKAGTLKEIARFVTQRGN